MIIKGIGSCGSKIVPKFDILFNCCDLTVFLLQNMSQCSEESSWRGRRGGGNLLPGRSTCLTVGGAVCVLGGGRLQTGGE